MKSRLGLAVLFSIVLTSGFATAAEYHVNWDGSADFEVIQEAIDASLDGDVIVVHPGTYYENVHFEGKNITLRSLDPDDQEIVGSTIIDGTQKGSVVTFAGTEDETCLLSGFTITNGKADYGGGVCGEWTFAVIDKCTISRNSAEAYGGGLESCRGAIQNCTIMKNSAGRSGGGLCACPGTISNCTASSNSADMDGGGLFWCGGTITKCVISHNWADLHGGGLRRCDGTINQCTIAGNSAGSHGGGLSGSDAKIRNCTITGNSAEFYGGGLWYCGATISNCTITDNSATGWVGSGGGLYSCHGTITNCTIGGNWAGWYGGGLSYYHGTISNCIVWGNQAGQEGKQLHSCEGAVITYCCVQGWTGGGEGNISDDPLFVSGPLGDYYLSCRAAGQATDSPCIDRGSTSAKSLGLDKFTTRTDGVPDTGIVDMGFHYPLPAEEKPTIECSLNQNQFSPWELLVASLEAHNEGPDVLVDVYVGFVLPDGSMLSYTGEGFVLGMAGWFLGVTLPRGFHFGPAPIFEVTIPGGAAGNYIYAAALTEPGGFQFIGEPSLFPFTISP